MGAFGTDFSPFGDYWGFCYFGGVLKASTERIVMRKNELLEVTLNLALEIVAYCEVLESLKKFVIARQLLRAGTSVGAHAREAQGAESKADFIHKLKIAYKEVSETEYWLQICKYSESYPDPPKDLLHLKDSSSRLLGRILSTARKNLK